jgi:hypothetical protein
MLLQKVTSIAAPPRMRAARRNPGRRGGESFREFRVLPRRLPRREGFSYFWDIFMMV